MRAIFYKDIILYKLIFFVPVAACESVKKAIFSTGAGSLGNYSNCSWQVLGDAQFTPSPAASPYIGKANTAESVAEFRVEILCEKNNIKKAIQALIQSHPYEKPAFEVYNPEEGYFDFYTQDSALLT
jgi:structural hemagglutinin/hemolysin toxin protein RtxA